jgi:cell division protein ZipA
MQANWSLVLNVVFLLVIVSMLFWRLRPYFQQKKQDAQQHRTPEAPLDASKKSFNEGLDDIIHVRKIESEPEFVIHTPQNDVTQQPNLGVQLPYEEPVAHQFDAEPEKQTIMLFLAAQGQNIFAGYELLQTLLSCGLRFGDAGLFHRHQHASGQGPVLFSLAAATATGVFDLQNIGAMSVKGLCMFMDLSGNVTIDQERFEIFLQTAKHLAAELDANLLDEKQKTVTEVTISKMQRLIAQEMTIDI